MNNKPVYQSRAKARKQDILDRVSTLKRVPCKDCGDTRPSCAMDFDHRESNKLFDVARMVSNGMSLPRILAEIEKCDVVCAACHRVRTFVRNNGYQPT